MQIDKLRLLKNTLTTAGALAATAIAAPAFAWRECGPLVYIDTICLNDCEKQDNYEQDCYECDTSGDCTFVGYQILSVRECSRGCGWSGYCSCYGGSGGGNEDCPMWWPPCWFC